MKCSDFEVLVRVTHSSRRKTLRTRRFKWVRESFLVPLLGGIFSGVILAQTTSSTRESVPAKDTAAPSLSLARELFMRGSYAEAAESYARIVEAGKDVIPASIGLAECRMMVGEYEKALAEFRAIDGETSADWLTMLARMYRVTGEYEKVQQHAQAAIKLEPKHPAPRRLLAETLEMLGRRDEAVEQYRWFDEQMVGGGALPRDAQRLTDLAVGFLRYSVLTQTNVPDRTRHVLQQMLQMAYERVDRTFWPARMEAADLLRERYNNDEADGSVSDYQAALKINPNIPAAHVGLGEVALEGWQFEKVEEHAQAALAINPNFAPAHHLLAKKLILERRYEQAIAAAEKALGINAHDLTAMSISAGAAACRYDHEHVEEMATRVSAINPRCAQFHHVVGGALSGIRQYAASEKEFLAAIELDPTDANARTELGMMYMQWGEEEKARAALEAAFAIDPFNQRTKFTLDLLDQLQHFATHESEHFIVRFDASRDPGLGAYVAEYLESVYAAVTGDYAFEPKDKTIIEFFPTMRAFAVRITGEPWIHTVGACTGRVIALSTPREAGAGAAPPYNLANVLTHEFTHTVTLAATENRIAHWFTEGLAVYQEDSPRDFRWIELLVDAIRHDRLFTLESIDWGFVRPQRQGDRQMAYAQSEWMVEYVVDRFGYDSIKRMIDRMRAGATQSDVFREVLKVEPESFEKDFGAWAREQAKSWCFDLTPAEDVTKLRELVTFPPCQVERSDPGAPGRLGGAGTDGGEPCAELLGRLARAEYDAEEFEAAEKAARKALELNENEQRALSVLVGLYAQQRAQLSPRDPRLAALDDESLPFIRRLMEVDKTGWFAPKARANIALHREEWDVAKETLTRLQAACPLDPFSWQGLAAVYLEQGDDKAALPQLVELARIMRDDPDVPAKIADIVRRKSNLAEAQHWYRQSLAIDPFDVAVHRKLGDVCMEAADYACALREYKMLTLIEPDKAPHFEAAAIAAKRAGDTEAMTAFAKRAVELNPQSPARSLFQTDRGND